MSLTSAKLSTYYELKEGKKITRLPVSVVDVDDLFIWLSIEPEAGVQWNVAVSWARIINEMLDEQVEELRKELEEAKANDLETRTNQCGDQEDNPT